MAGYYRVHDIVHKPNNAFFTLNTQYTFAKKITLSIENRMNANAFRDIWARVLFFKFSKIGRAAGAFFV